MFMPARGSSLLAALVLFGALLGACGKPERDASVSGAGPALQPQAQTPDSDVAPAAVSGLEAIAPLRCIGTEPYWRIDIAADGSAVCADDCEVDDVLAVDDLVVTNDATQRYALALMRPDGQPFAQMSLTHSGQCSDGMSEFRYAYDVTVARPDAPVWQGCCNRIDTAAELR